MIFVTAAEIRGVWQRKFSRHALAMVAVFAFSIALCAALLRGAPTTRPATGPSTQPVIGEQLRITRARANLAILESALDQFELDCGRYPTAAEGLAALVSRPPDVAGWHGPYVKKLADDPWGRPYRYRCPGLHKNDFDLFSIGPDGAEGGRDEITNWDEK